MGAAGFTDENAVPILGDPTSFINNPDVTGSPVVPMPTCAYNVNVPNVNFASLLGQSGKPSAKQRQNALNLAFNLEDGGKRATLSGDIMHHPIQVYYPEWSSQFCWDQEMSARSRRKLLEDCVESNALLCPAHFPGANAGHIKPQGDAFKIEWDVVK